MSTVKLISFDLDDTLWELRQVLNRACASTSDWVATNYPSLSQEYSARMQQELPTHDQDGQVIHQFSMRRKVLLNTIAAQSDLNDAEQS